MDVRRVVLSLAASNVATRRLQLRTLSAFSIPIPPIVKRNPLPFTKNQNSASSEFIRISKLLSDPNLRPGADLVEALRAAGIKPSPTLLLEVFDRFNATPKPLLTVFNWAREQPDYQFSIAVFNAVVDSLGRAREFDSAWCLILAQIEEDMCKRPDIETFVIMIRRYSRAGLTSAAIRTFEYVSTLEYLHDSVSGTNLFEILLDSLCKEGHVRIASQYCVTQRAKDPSWLVSVRVYNILLNGWLRSRKLKRAMSLWEQMKREGVKPSVVTYGTLVEGLCRMGHPDMAMELLNEMKTEGVEPNAIVYNPIIDALGEAGRFNEALGMLERSSILEHGPTVATYNSLVKGFCKAGDLVGASKIIKMMMDNQCMPTPTTYGYFFKHFSKQGMIDVALNLYTKMLGLGYEPDRLIYHLLVKMLCKGGKLDLVTRVINEMRTRGFDLDLATSTMQINLLWKMNKYSDAVFVFEEMFRRGIVPQNITYQTMTKDLEKRGMAQIAQKLHDLMASVPHSTKLPDTYKQFKNASRERKISVIRRAEAISDALKTFKDPRELVKHRNHQENVLFTAEKLIDRIQKKTKVGRQATIRIGGQVDDTKNNSNECGNGFSSPFSRL